MHLSKNDQASLSFSASLSAYGNLSAPDTFAPLPTLDLIGQIWPTLTDLRGDLGDYRPLIDCRKASRVLGFEAIYSVRDEGA